MSAEYTTASKHVLENDVRILAVWYTRKVIILVKKIKYTSGTIWDSVVTRKENVVVFKLFVRLIL